MGRSSIFETAELPGLARELASGVLTGVAELFATAGLSAPHVVWSPAARDFHHPLVRAFASDCDKLRNADGRLSVENFARLDRRAYDGWILELEPDEDQTNFTYVSYGVEIAELYGRNMLGHSTEEFGGFISEFFLSLYRAIMARGEWCLSLHEPPKFVFASHWRRLIIPLFDDAGQVVRIVVLNVAESELRVGLDVVPVPCVVVRYGGQIAFVNRAAKLKFGIPDREMGTRNVARYVGMEVPLGSFDPDADFGRQVVTLHEADQINGVVRPNQITVSPILYRDTCLKLVMIREY